jgi:hypothetical protein
MDLETSGPLSRSLDSLEKKAGVWKLERRHTHLVEAALSRKGQQSYLEACQLRHNCGVLGQVQTIASKVPDWAWELQHKAE